MASASRAEPVTPLQEHSTQVWKLILFRNMLCYFYTTLQHLCSHTDPGWFGFGAGPGLHPGWTRSQNRLYKNNSRKEAKEIILLKKRDKLIPTLHHCKFPSLIWDFRPLVLILNPTPLVHDQTDKIFFFLVKFSLKLSNFSKSSRCFIHHRLHPRCLRHRRVFETKIRITKPKHHPNFVNILIFAQRPKWFRE